MAKRETAPAISVTWRQVLALRLHRQHVIDRLPADCLVEVVGGMMGLHAQVMSSAELQAAARIDGLRPADVQDALWERRSLVKTWAYRQTLHLLAPDDLAEFVVAARTLERWHTPGWLRYFEMTEREIEQVIEAIGAALGDRPMTRVEVTEAVLARVKRPKLRKALMTGWGTFLGPAAQCGRLVFGPSIGRNVAFVDPRAWLGRRIDAARGDPNAADIALARLLARYLVVFPGSSREMAGRWWGGRVTLSRALKHAPVPLVEVDVEGIRGLVREDDVEALRATRVGRHVRLLPGFDPFTNELPRKVESVLGEARHALVHRTAGWVTPIVVVDGRVAGTWEIEGGPKDGRVAVVALERWRTGARKELKAEVERIAAFLDRPLSVSVSGPAVE